MSARAGTLAALLAALGRPSWWILALAGFLARGGILLFLLAIVTLPSPLALANVLEPIVTPLYLGRLEPGTLVLIVGAVAIFVAWLVLGSWFAAATEVALIEDARDAALDEELPIEGAARARPRLASRAATAHLLALVPAAVALGVGSIQIFDVAYRELVNPTDAGPIVLRVLAGATTPVATILAIWVLGEIVGGLAVRRIVVGGQSVLGAVVRAAVDLVRRPIASLVVPILTTLVLALDLAAVLTVVMVVWSQVRVVLVHPAQEPVATALTLVGLGAAWCLALLVTGLIDSWRSVAMTFATARGFARPVVDDAPGPGPGSGSRAVADGTFGASTHGRPGDWSADDRGGSL